MHKRLDNSAQSTAQSFPLFALAGRDAAALWLAGAPMSAGAFRDLRFRNLAAGLGSLDDLAGRTQAFNDAFADCIAHSIAQHSHAEVRHG